MNQSPRYEFINQQLVKLHSLLEQWQQYQLTARDPSEQEHSNREIARIRQLISEYEQELQGGSKVEEQNQKPFRKPDPKKNIRRVIMGILIAFLLITIGVYFFVNSNEVTPDYTQYLNYLNKGDSLVKENKYAEAKKSYKKALQYNPGDSAAIKKIDYLKKADELIQQNKFEEAKNLFKVVIEISASPGLSQQATAAASNESNGPPALQVDISWSGGTLTIKISGGTPFKEKGAEPYNVEGLGCKACIEWSENKSVFTGKIAKEKVNTISIKIEDSRGVDVQTPIPPIPAAAQAPSPVTNPANTTEENFKALVESGDQYFTANKFAQALSDYQAALQLKPGAKEVADKIAACNKKIGDEKIQAAKNIPRISIGGGSFTMGNENGFPVDRPEHAVKLSPFALGKTEVTVAQYRAYCGLTGKLMPAQPAGGWVEENPVTGISWAEAKSYCEWVGGRLPTEAEWEYAAKEAGAVSKTYSGGNDAARVAVYKDNSGNKPSRVGQKQPNALGLYDMSGNVSEWCNDWFGTKYYATSEPANPKGPASGTQKVIRGGAYNSSVTGTQDGNQLRTTYRNAREASVRESYIGFRVGWDK